MRPAPLLAISTGCYYGFGVVTEEAIDHVRDSGADGVEVYIQGLPELESKVLDVIVERARDAEISVVSIHPYVYGWENLLFATYQRQRNWATQHVARHLELCTAIGARAYVSHGPPEQHALDEQHRFSSTYTSVTRDLVAMAAEYGVQYCLENVSYGLAKSPDDLRRHLDAIPTLKFVIDFKSAWKSGHSPSAFLTPDLLPAVHHTQVSFRDDGRYGLPARSTRSALNDLEIVAALRTDTPHVIEIEAASSQDVIRSLNAVRFAQEALRGRTNEHCQEC